MTTQSVSIGMVGTSWWADSMHLPALEEHPNAKVTAICGRNRDRAQTMADRWEIPYVFTDYNEMVENTDLDAVIISTANDTHYPFTMKALEHNLHVLCEKPIALAYAQAKEMADTAEAKGVKHLVPFTYSFMPTARYMKELIDDGYIGKPYHLNMRYYTGYARGGEYGWRFNKAISGSGILGDIASHFLYLAEWFYGPIKQMYCQFGYNVERPELDPDGNPYEKGDDMSILTFEFENGAFGTIHASAVCYEDTQFGQTHHMEFHGSGGTLYNFIDWDTIQQIKGAKDGEGAIKELPVPERIWGDVRRDTVHNTYKDLFRKENFMIRQFITAIVEDGTPYPDLHDGARIQRLIEAAIRSDEIGARVEIESIK